MDPDVRVQREARQGESANLETMARHLPASVADLAPDGRLTRAQARHLLLEISRRRLRPGAGSAPEFLQRRTALNPWPDLRGILGGMDWIVVGGVATRAFMAERATKDLDLLVRREDGQEVLQRLKRAGFQVVGPLAAPGYIVQSPDGVDVDVLLGSQPWLDEALKQPATDPAGYPVADLPYLVLSKLEASRAQDVADMSRMLGWAEDDDLRRVREAVARYRPEDLDDLESLVYLGQHERGAQDARY